MNNNIQVGIPCLNEQLCFWVGVAFGVCVLALILYFIFSAYRDRQKTFKRHRKRKALRKQKQRSE